MMKTILVYILKLFNVTISIAVFIVPGLYFDSIGPLCITWLFALMTFSYLDEAVNKIEEHEFVK